MKNQISEKEYLAALDICAQYKKQIEEQYSDSLVSNDLLKKLGSHYGSKMERHIEILSKPVNKNSFLVDAIHKIDIDNPMKARFINCVRASFKEIGIDIAAEDIKMVDLQKLSSGKFLKMRNSGVKTLAVFTELAAMAKLKIKS